MLVQSRPGVHHVAQMFGHLLAVFVLHVAEYEAVLEGSLFKQERRDRKQGVEPPARLVHRLADEIGGETLVKYVRVFKGIVPLRKGHGARIVPAVDHFRHAVHGLAAVRAGDFHIVDEGTVQLDIIRNGAGCHLDQLLRLPMTCW